MTISLHLKWLFVIATISAPVSWAADPSPRITGAGMKENGQNGVPAAGTVLQDAGGNPLTQTDVDAFPAWVLSSPSGTSTALFKAADDFRNIPKDAPHPARMILMFKDEAPGEYHLYYDSNDSQTYRPNEKPGAWKPLPVLKTTGTGHWEMAEWQIPDARFGGDMNGGDLYLEGAGGKPLTIRGIYFQTDYPIADEMFEHPGVPKGDIIDFVMTNSKMFPGATHAIRIYVPKQYDATHPACVWISQDGGVPSTMLDNLIAKKQVPVMISIGVKSGQVPYPGGKDAKGKYVSDFLYRSLEYACVNDNYVRFLTEEVYPEVEKHKTPDGRQIRLSRDGKDAGIDGGSAGGICAFVAAWVRPDAFSRTYSTFGGLDGFLGNIPAIVRVMETRPIRVFLQDNKYDLNWFAGDLWMANQTLDRALELAGYQHDHAWGDGGHDGVQSGHIFPDVMRYLWKDWPAPVRITRYPGGVNGLIPGEDWNLVWTGQTPATSLASNADGEVYFNNDGKCYKIGLDGKVVPFADHADADGDAAFGSDGRLYQVDSTKAQVVAYDKGGNETVVTEGIKGCGIAALSKGRFYVSEPGGRNQPGHIWLVETNGNKRIVATVDDFAPGSLAVNPDETNLAIRALDSLWGYSFQMTPDGSLHNEVRRYPLMDSESFDPRKNEGGVICDLDGNNFFASHLGLQNNQELTKGIIAPPPVTGVQRVTLGGKNLTTFFISSGNSIYLRRTHYRGQPPPR